MNAVESPACLAIIAGTSLVTLVALGSPGLMRDYAIHPWRMVREGLWHQMFTSGMLHVGLGHLLVNMVSLFFFGTVMERFLGPGRFLILYFGSLFFGSLLTAILHRRNPAYRAVGASGAVSGVVFSFVLFRPLAPIYLFFIPIGIPAILFAIGYAALSIHGARTQRGRIGHAAHLGGALGGVILTLVVYPDALRIFLEHFR